MDIILISIILVILLVFLIVGFVFQNPPLIVASGIFCLLFATLLFFSDGTYQKEKCSFELNNSITNEIIGLNETNTTTTNNFVPLCLNETLYTQTTTEKTMANTLALAMMLVGVGLIFGKLILG